MYDKEIADLEEQLFEARTLLRFFGAFIHNQPGRQIKITDKSFLDKEKNDLCDLYIYHDESDKSTVIGLR